MKSYCLHDTKLHKLIYSQQDVCHYVLKVEHVDKRDIYETQLQVLFLKPNPNLIQYINFCSTTSDHLSREWKLKDGGILTCGQSFIWWSSHPQLKQWAFGLLCKSNQFLTQTFTMSIIEKQNYVYLGTGNKSGYWGISFL